MADTGAPWNLPYPVSSDLVRDGAQAIQDLAESVADSFVVKQVVFASTSTEVVNSTDTYEDTTLTATITPTSASSRVLVLVSQQGEINGASAGQVFFGIRLLRGSTVVFTPVTDANGPYDYGVGAGSSLYTRLHLAYVDSPNAATATTYKTQGRRYASGSTVFQAANPTNGTSTITLIEVA
jgi:hypothetical protein